MALYHHVTDRDDLIDAMVDEVFADRRAVGGRRLDGCGDASETLRFATPCRATAGRSA